MIIKETFRRNRNLVALWRDTTPLWGGAGGEIFAATWDDAVEKLVDKIWEQQVKAEELNRDLVIKYYNCLNKAAQQGWGKNYYNENITRNFRENLLKTAGAKSYNLIKKIEDLKNNSADKQNFINTAKNLIDRYNTWQDTENNFVSKSASNARDFNEYIKNSEVFPNLKNHTLKNTNIRNSHAINEGVVKPVNEWNEIPPYCPNCRCWLEQTTDPATKNGLQNINPYWASNPAFTGKFFTDKNKYFTKIDAKLKLLVRNNTESMKEFMPYNKTIKVDENTVYINDFADRKDLANNRKAAEIIAKELKKNIFIRPHIDVDNVKNPELGIGKQNSLGDLKILPKPEIGNFIGNNIKSANKQGCKYVVLDITKYSGNTQKLNTNIKNSLFSRDGDERCKKIKILIIIRDGNVIQLTRKQIKNNMFENLDLLNDKRQ